MNAILEDLRKNASLLEIREKYRSQSQIYEAIRQYLVEADKAIIDRRQRIVVSDAEIAQGKKELEDLQYAKETLSKEFQKEQAEAEQLTGQNRELEEKRLWLHNEVAGLNAKGYTPAILRKIGRIEAREGPALWTDVKSIA